jgi:hypothetical protein
VNSVAERVYARTRLVTGRIANTSATMVYDRADREQHPSGAGGEPHAADDQQDRSGDLADGDDVSREVRHTEHVSRMLDIGAPLCPFSRRAVAGCVR